MSSSTPAQIKRALRRHLPELREKYSVESLALFGSYARGEEHSESDIDLLVTFEEPPGLLAFLDLERMLSKLLGRSVDLVSKDALKPRIGDCVQREVEPI